MVTLFIPSMPYWPQQSLKCSLISSTVAEYSTFLTQIDLFKILSSDDYGYEILESEPGCDGCFSMEDAVATGFWFDYGDNSTFCLFIASNYFIDCESNIDSALLS